MVSWITHNSLAFNTLNDYLTPMIEDRVAKGINVDRILHSGTIEATIAMGEISELALFLIFLMAATFLYFLMSSFLGVKKDPREVPGMPSIVPFVGHIVGLIRHKMLYYVRLR